MAIRTLNSLQFPGLVDIYKLPPQADEYDASVTYEVDDHCVYKGQLYRCIQTAVNRIPEDEPTYWLAVTLSEEVQYYKSVIENQIAEPFSITKSYLSGEYIEYNNNLYKFISYHAAGSWNPSHVVPVKVGEELNSISESAGLSVDVIADSYDANDTYLKDDYVMYEGNFYRCLVDIDQPEMWDNSHWALVNVGDELTEVQHKDSSSTKLGSITLLAANWSSSTPKTQVVSVSGATITNSSKVDVQLTAEQLAAFQSMQTSVLLIENNQGVLTAYAIGAAPTQNVTVQCTVTELITPQTSSEGSGS